MVTQPAHTVAAWPEVNMRGLFRVDFLVWDTGWVALVRRHPIKSPQTHPWRLSQVSDLSLVDRPTMFTQYWKGKSFLVFIIMAFCNMAKHYSLKQMSSPHRGGKFLQSNQTVTRRSLEYHSAYVFKENGTTAWWPAAITLFKQTRETKSVTWPNGCVRKEQEFMCIYAS